MSPQIYILDLLLPIFTNILLRDPMAHEIDALTLEGVRSAVMAQLHPGNVEVSVVGDFNAEELGGSFMCPLHEPGSDPRLYTRSKCYCGVWPAIAMLAACEGLCTSYGKQRQMFRPCAVA